MQKTTSKPRDKGLQRAQTIGKILDAAEACFLERGVGGTSIDQMIKRAGISKGNFFYYFKGKEDLTLQLTERYFEREVALLNQLDEAAAAASNDPLEQVLHVLMSLRKIYAESLDRSPGCLYAVLVYEPELVGSAVHRVTRKSVESWRKRFGDKLKAAMAIYPTRLLVDPASVADQINAAFGGALLVSRIERSPKLVAEQLDHSIHYLRLLFDRADPTKHH